ncbi:MAG: type II toxin-antitoxin system VapC family toxin [Chloroflexi bacterium]|nr:type II toxin-antitoxin system VapC family toxin [Chloroflexota bacterium]
MFLYLDTSALVKRYVIEAGTAEVNQATARAETNGTVTITRVEVVAALAKAVRIGALEQTVALSNLQKFRNEWSDLTRIHVTDHLVMRADTLAWEHHLRGYDAVHLAAALVWQEGLGATVTIATFDQSLWLAAQKEGLAPFPADLPLDTKTTKRKIKK